jgi:hypothetical protein
MRSFALGLSVQFNMPEFHVTGLSRQSIALLRHAGIEVQEIEMKIVLHPLNLKKSVFVQPLSGNRAASPSRVATSRSIETPCSFSGTPRHLLLAIFASRQARIEAVVL